MQENFRDKLSTIDSTGKRVWIYPKKPSGPFHRARAVVSVFLLVFFYSAPFITIDGKPLLMLNILERKFIIFGVGFWPQDFHLFVLATIALIVFIILFTVAFGRIFCGWACPQTVFMEMVFRKIEYLIEGDAAQQRKLNAASMSPIKFLRKSLKHAVFFSIAFVTGNTFLAYVIGKDTLFKIISDPPSEHIVGLIAMILFSGAFYFVFAFFREQACTLVCPYGRLQGVLLDKKSIVVAYDFKRGEPRGKAGNPENGDCVDCSQCVEVCPTGIDIRNGTQLECVNCTACIDACNSIMQKVKRPKGLIRYDSYTGIEQGDKKRLNVRTAAYSGVLSIILIILISLLVTRDPVETTILRTPGTLFQETADGQISNLYNIKIINKTFEDIRLELKLRNNKAALEMIGGDLLVPGGELKESSFFIKIPKDDLSISSSRIRIDVYSGDELIDEIVTSFMKPNRINKQ